ncbi:MAG: type III pantothenate kinase [Saprospiraceae bacterium]|nr:type III pantothenate kinase [Saprospiraceae bacterium]
MLNLVTDIGNTRVKAGLFREGELVQQWLWGHEKFSFELLKQTATNHNAQNIILSTVRQLPEDEAWQSINEDCFCLMLSETTPLPFQNLYRTPQTLGKDRLAAVAGAQALFPGQNCLVADAGTCITYEVLTANGSYLGGNIAPGLRMRLQAMHEFTAKLPLVEPGETENLFGYDTKSAMQNGAQEGIVLELEGYANHCRALFGPVQVLLTGGDADFLSKKLKSEIFVDQNLVLRGLDQILSYNVHL